MNKRNETHKTHISFGILHETAESRITKKDDATQGKPNPVIRNDKQTHNTTTFYHQEEEISNTKKKRQTNLSIFKDEPNRLPNTLWQQLTNSMQQLTTIERPQQQPQTTIVTLIIVEYTYYRVSKPNFVSYQ